MLTDFSCDCCHLQLTDGLRDLNLTRTSHRAVESSVTTGKSAGLADDLHALGSGFIAAVKNEAVRRDQRSGAKIIVTAPEGWTGGGAGRAQDALGRFVEACPLFGRLEALFSIRRERAFVDEIRKHLLIVIEERFHVHDQILDNLQAEQWLDGNFVADIAYQSFASQMIASVDAHRVRSAHAVRT